MAKRQRHEKKPQKLNTRILRTLLMGWMLPLLALSLTVFYFMSQQLGKQIRDTVQKSADTAVEVSEMRMEASIQASRDASYIPRIKESWHKYQKTENSQTLYDDVYGFISQMYKYDANFLSTMVYFREMPERVYYIYSSIHNADYDSVRFFQEWVRKDADLLADKLDTKIGFVGKDNHLYMVRNIVEKDYEPLATIVMELDQDVIFQSLKGIGWYEDVCVYIDGALVYQDNGQAVTLQHETNAAEKKGSVYYEKEGTAFVTRTKNLEGHEIRYMVLLDVDALRYERNYMTFLLLVILLFAIPLVGIICWFLYKNVNRPVIRLVKAANEIEGGNFGYQIESEERSAEFAYLTGAFNSMSDKLKNQFEQIYLEELALKDADIKALQSQINPHFLNNTLEIINWEARMSGNEKVSSMIEALSTMLEATLNRKRQPMIPLSEELEYVDAYSYIIKQRFGDKLQFEKQIDKTLLQEEVPRLIIQPIIENAVEHGLSGRQGIIMIRIYREQEFLKVEVVNNGALLASDKDKIDRLLNGEEDTEHSTSIGIANVNKRLKIIYGQECGLSIKSTEDGFTVSTITVKMHK